MTNHAPLPARLTSLGAAVFAASLLLNSPAQAQNRSWNISGGGSFNNSSNWSSTVAPVATGTATFRNDATGTITFTGATTVADLNLSNTSGALKFDLTDGDGAPHHFTTSTWIRIGESANPTETSPNNVTFNGGTVSFSRIQFNGSGNQVTIDDSAFSGASATQYLRLDGSGNTLLIKNGGQLLIKDTATSVQQNHIGGTASSSSNTIIVSGSGSKFEFRHSMVIGERAGSVGNSLQVLEGGTVVDSGALTMIGNREASGSTLKISGTGSQYTGSALVILGGNHATGSTGNSISANDGGKLILSSTLSVGGTVAASSGNSLEVDGGIAEVHTLRIGYSSSNNIVTIKGGGHLESAGSILVGRNIADSSGNQLNVSGSATVQAGKIDSLSTLHVSKGALTIDSGSVRAGNLLVEAADAANASITFKSGTLELEQANVAKNGGLTIGDAAASSAAVYRMTDASGVHTYNNGITLQKNARIEGTGTLAAAITIAGAGVVVDVGPDSSAGIMQIQSTWNNTGVTLNLDLGDFSSGTATAGSNFDQLLFTGTFTLGGTVNFDISSFAPPEEGISSFKAIGWTTFTGISDDLTVQFGTATPYLSYTVESDGLYVTVIPEPGTIGAFFSGLAILAGAVLRGRKRLA